MRLKLEFEREERRPFNESENSKGVKVKTLIDRNNLVEDNKGIKVNPLNDVIICVEDKISPDKNQITWKILRCSVISRR